MTIFDSIDLKILTVLHRQGVSLSTTSLAKTLFAITDRYDLIKQDVLIRRHLKKMQKLGVVESNQDGKRKLYSIEKKVIRKSFRINQKVAVITKEEVLTCILLPEEAVNA
ncbi:MAG: helix-turn-helix domain-containing protein [archaeon]